MEVKIKILHPDAVLPFKNYSDDFCCDVTATSKEEIAPNVWKYGIGFAFQIDRKTFCFSKTDVFGIDFRPRSSVWKTGMVLSNSVGTIDESYTGEVSAVFYHIMPNMPRYKVGDRIGQIKINYTENFTFRVADELEETKRKDGSYGSTGS
jgi:dUTP pyrophosphatase